MFKEFFAYLKTKQTKRINELEKKIQPMKELNTMLIKQLLDECKGDVYSVVTLNDGTRIEFHQTRFKEQNTEKKYNEYW